MYGDNVFYSKVKIYNQWQNEYTFQTDVQSEIKNQQGDGLCYNKTSQTCLS